MCLPQIIVCVRSKSALRKCLFTINLINCKLDSGLKSEFQL